MFRVVGTWHVGEMLVLWYWRTQIYNSPSLPHLHAELDSSKKQSSRFCRQPSKEEKWYGTGTKPTLLPSGQFLLKTHPNLSGRHPPPTALQKACGGS